MGRPPRSIDLIPGGVYHVMSRGNRKAVIFEDNRTRKRFRDILAMELEAHGVELLVDCEMDTHYHLTVMTPFGNLSDFMEQLNWQFARYSNWRYKYVGHVFQGPFRHVLIESDLHLFAAISYVFRNPVKARIAKTLDAYDWSSYASTVGLTARPGHLSIDWVRFLFPAPTLEDSQRRLRRVMDDPNPIAAYLLSIEGQISNENTKRSSRCYVTEQRLKARERLARRPPLEELIARDSKDRAQVIYEAHVLYGYSLRDLSKAMRLDPSNVSRIFRQFLRRQRR